MKKDSQMRREEGSAKATRPSDETLGKTNGKTLIAHPDN
jgi:hypothetical protein